MTPRWRIRRKVLNAIHRSQGEGKNGVRHAARLSRWRDQWKLLPVPQEYQDRHQYDFTDDRDRDFLHEVLRVWDLYPNLRDAICSIFGVWALSERLEWRATVALVLSIIAIIIALLK